MRSYKKTIRYTILIIVCLSLMVGCQKKSSQNQESSSSKLLQQGIKDKESKYTSELKDITSSERIDIDDDTPAQGKWTSKDQEATLSEVLPWLKQAKLYKGEMPEASNLGKDEPVFNANIGPSILSISTSNKHIIKIKPAFHINSDNGHINYYVNVVEFDYDGQKTYIESNQLYEWLKNNKWKTEFEHL
ncbi:hypothetical protein CSC2_05020 [Clostridium zeae]|uniref:Lipoprotein n=1 Tax=Clostridium zeae TaxID=2759022 RepID=A0ABQ1E5G7_9CLOT|nr:hypothetical protein [Clostridium zeae]GFZ29976.1 hypothetical protein CSC2_05020 [Clostridium zeae]